MASSSAKASTWQQYHASWRIGMASMAVVMAAKLKSGSKIMAASGINGKIKKMALVSWQRQHGAISVAQRNSSIMAWQRNGHIS